MAVKTKQAETESKTETEIETVTDVETEAIKEKAVIYIGPDIKNVIGNKQVLLTLPAALVEFKKKCPEIEHLLVKVGQEYRTAIKDLTVKGSAVRHYYETVFNYVQKSMKGV